jgi:multimeric flavodoxin WrbA
MHVLGLQGSPRKNSNTQYLLDIFLDAAARRGARTHRLDICKMDIQPCRELVVCEKKGFCPIKDEMRDVVYPLLRQAEIIVAASPVFFYNVTAQLKALIDRSQTLWARKYRLKLKDPYDATRQGFLLGVGATRGKQLFDGMQLTATYFFDAVAAAPAGSLTYREVEHPGDMAEHPTVHDDVEAAVAQLMDPLDNRTRVLFAGQQNAAATQMAEAFLQTMAGDRFDVSSGGNAPADEVPVAIRQAMAAAGIDIEFRQPRPLSKAIEEERPERIIRVGDDASVPAGAPVDDAPWDLPEFAEADPASAERLRDAVRDRVEAFIDVADMG